MKTPDSGPVSGDRELLISQRARLRYGLADALFAASGRAIVTDPRKVREAAQTINRIRSAGGVGERPVKASVLHAAGLLHELMHLVMGVYRQRVNPGVFRSALAELEVDLGVAEVETVLETFVEAFPPEDVRRDEILPAAYLEGRTGDTPNREIVLEEILLLWLANANPALEDLRDLFDDGDLRQRTAYLALVDRLQVFFSHEPGMERGGATLIEMLRAPVVAAPHSLRRQLEHIRRSWAPWLGDLVLRLLGGLDFLAEEDRPFFPPGPGPIHAPTYPSPAEDVEFEAFSPDRDWMPRVVLLAKNSHVWLAQLSEDYGRSITTLDDVPDEELDRLAGRGFTGLWLIGIWERSSASARIKQWMGDHEAVASAYSLYDYAVAGDLGGEEAFDRLKERAWRRGIRMTTDMVPNHVGIDGRWVVEHPDWFVGVDHCPFPQYSFTGADLGEDERVGVHIEDGYWDRSDAAVVFKRVDKFTGSERYIYHGNDGTSMPWNDTAQLDYRNPEVREAVIQTILHVARRSPVIRFDAAMTLTRRNFQRLWFPEPGSGGDIPSRAEHGMSREDFDRAMPQEFWREVVDRVAAEAPDTLLLAEAFWMLEGYFVRTLGMHRVYNSAFMNMLHEEKNAEYRVLIRNTLEYDPRILSRYVNFMSNPDERTAIDQFGRDDKYFGVCTLMATMPGLPMFGHGQVEGFAEKYGMEFRRPRWNEQVDADLVARHERQIFPLLMRRSLFAGVERFRLYDLVDGHGEVDENVFAYSNQEGGERCLVIFHNRFAETSGWIYRAVPVRQSGELVHPNLAEGLALEGAQDDFLAFRDVVTGLEYLRPVWEVRERGLFVGMKAYELHVFVDFSSVSDRDGSCAALAAELAGRGVPDLDRARRELLAAPVLEPWRELLQSGALEPAAPRGVDNLVERKVDVEDELLTFFAAVRSGLGVKGSVAEDADRVLSEVRTARAALSACSDDGLGERVGTFLDDAPWRQMTIAARMVARRLAHVAAGAPEEDADAFPWEIVDRWGLDFAVEDRASELGASAEESRNCGRAVVFQLAVDGWVGELKADGPPPAFLREMLGRPAVEALLGVNVHEGTTWFLQEGLEAAADWLAVGAVVETRGDEAENERAAEAIDRLETAAVGSGYRLDRLFSRL